MFTLQQVTDPSKYNDRPEYEVIAKGTKEECLAKYRKYRQYVHTLSNKDRPFRLVGPDGEIIDAEDLKAEAHPLA